MAASRSSKGKKQVDPDVLRGMEALGRGDRLAAAALFEGALRRKPRSAEPHYGLGVLAIAESRFEDAASSLETAVRRDGTVATYHAKLSSVLANLWRLDAAVAAIDKARWLDPNNPEHHAQASSILERLGRVDDAQQAADRALALDPAHARARVMSVRLAVRKRRTDGQPTDQWRTELRTIGSDPRVNPLLRSLAWEALGDLCDAIGETDEAFEAFVQTNRADAQWQAVPSQAERDHYLDWTQRLADSLSREKTERWRDECPDDGLPSPALLVGFPRSGTTMTERALDAHPRVTSMEELPTFRTLVREMMDAYQGRNERIEEVNDILTPEEVSRLRARYWEVVAELRGEPVPDGMVFLDKLPLRTAQLGLINRLFPDAPTIFALRDPRDVCLSNLRQRFRMSTTMSFTLTLEQTAQLYAHVMGIWLQTRDLYTLPFHVIRYEDVVSDFERHTREMVAFLGLEWDDAVLSFHERKDAAVANTPSYHTVRQKVSRRAVGRWKRYERGLTPALPTLDPFIDEFGYRDGA